MGSHNRNYSSVTTTVGISVNSSMKQFLVIASVAALGFCTPDADADPAASPDADAFYGQYQWPGYGVGTPYGALSSTCYGCRPYHFIGKRSAEPHGTGVAVHPGVATSFVGPTTYGYPHVLPLHYGKREAEAAPEAEASPDADAFYGYYGHPVAYGGYGYGWPGGYTSVSGIYGYPYWG